MLRLLRIWYAQSKFVGDLDCGRHPRALPCCRRRKRGGGAPSWEGSEARLWLWYVISRCGYVSWGHSSSAYLLLFGDRCLGPEVRACRCGLGSRILRLHGIPWIRCW